MRITVCDDGIAWLILPNGDRIAPTLKECAAEIKRLTRERDEARDKVQRYAEHHEHCTITTYHGLREISERNNLRALLEEVKRCLPGTLERVPELRDRINQALSEG